jgi:hypothetical protein
VLALVSSLLAFASAEALSFSALAFVSAVFLVSSASALAVSFSALASSWAAFFSSSAFFSEALI